MQCSTLLRARTLNPYKIPSKMAYRTGLTTLEWPGVSGFQVLGSEFSGSRFIGFIGFRVSALWVMVLGFRVSALLV